MILNLISLWLVQVSLAYLLSRLAGLAGARPGLAQGHATGRGGRGGFALSIAAAVVGAVPCLGSILVLGSASIGLGAVALSRFGTSPHGSRPAEA